jgi:hypothetical protein
MIRIISILGLTLLILTPSSLFGQDRIAADTPLALVLAELYSSEIATNIAAGGAGAEADLNDALIITAAIGSQLSTFPLGSSAGGFSFTFEPGIGFGPPARSFGPLFAERALTTGRGKLNFGVNFQRAKYDEFDGRDLRKREIVFFTPYPSGNIGEDSLLLNVSANTVGVLANYGLTNQLDVGVVVPIVSVKLDANLRFIFRDPVSGVQQGAFEQTLAGGGSKTGIGDVVLRAKYKAASIAGGGLAVGLDLRLPTGDEENLLGIAGTQAKIYGVLSTTAGNLSPHVNLGYTFSRGNDLANDPDSVFLAPPDEVSYTFGADMAVTPRLTIAGDIIGRTLRGVPRLRFGDVGFGSLFQEFTLEEEEGSLNLVLGSVGGKYKPWADSDLLVTANLLFPLTSVGLRDKLTPVIGFDYSF